MISKLVDLAIKLTAAGADGVAIKLPFFEFSVSFGGSGEGDGNAMGFLLDAPADEDEATDEDDSEGRRLGF